MLMTVRFVLRYTCLYYDSLICPEVTCLYYDSLICPEVHVPMTV